MTDSSEPVQDSKPLRAPSVPSENPSIEVQVKADLEGNFVQKYFSEQERNYVSQQRNCRVQVWLAIVTTLAFIAAAIYAFIAHRQLAASNGQLATMQDTLGELKNQTQLIKQQLIGTQAAVVVIHDFPGIESPQTNNYSFYLGLQNEGRVIATKVHVTLTIQRKTVSTENPIGESWPCEFELPPITPATLAGSAGEIREHQCFLNGLNKGSWQPVLELQQTIAVDGNFSYWDGFEQVLSQPVCLRYVPNGIKTAFGSEGLGRFVPCDHYPGYVEYLKARMAGDTEIKPPQ